jgi:hypothetical protein
MNQENLAYCVYLVRLWRAGSPAQPAFRISLERPGSAERHVFGDLPSMFMFFEEEARRLATWQPDPPPGRVGHELP